MTANNCQVTVSCVCSFIFVHLLISLCGNKWQWRWYVRIWVQSTSLLIKNSQDDSHTSKCNHVITETLSLVWSALFAAKQNKAWSLI